MNNDEILDDVLFEDDIEGIPVPLISVNKFAILSVLSFGLYPVWWSYKIWRFFKEKDRLEIMPAARAIFGIFYTFGLFERIHQFAIQNGYTKSNYSSIGFFVIYIVLNIFSVLPPPFWLLSLFAFIAFISPVKAFNLAIQNSNFFRSEYESGFNYRQWIILILGGVFFSLVLFSLIYVDQF